MQQTVAFFITRALLLGCALLQGCSELGLNLADETHLSVDAMTDYKNQSGLYFLIPARKNLDANQLRYKSFKRYLIRALSYNGFTQTRQFKKAKLVIFFDYGIGGPKTQYYHYNLPIWGETGITYGTDELGISYYHPHYGITGIIPETGSITTYASALNITAYDIKKNKNRKPRNMQEAWYVHVVAVDSRGDLRHIFPYLVAGAERYLAQNTDGYENITLRADDLDLLLLQTTTQPPHQDHPQKTRKGRAKKPKASYTKRKAPPA